MLNMRRLKKFACSRSMRGASMTEFIIVSPIALLLMLGILQFGLIYMAKLTLNNATFHAARHGATVNGSKREIELSLAKGLIPFYVRTNALTSADPAAAQPGGGQLLQAGLRAGLDMLAFSEVDVISPSVEAFQQFGVQRDGRRVIPNDNIEYRSTDAGSLRMGPESRQISIRDANILKIKVTYGYELKVPLIRTILQKVMCLGAAGGGSVDAWAARNLVGFDLGNCARYYLLGRIPIVSYATVHMQSDADETVVRSSSSGSGAGSGSAAGTGSGASSGSGSAAGAGSGSSSGGGSEAGSTGGGTGGTSSGTPGAGGTPVSNLTGSTGGGNTSGGNTGSESVVGGEGAAGC